MGKKIVYKSITRVENCIIEEKIDGSNFGWKIKNGILKTFGGSKEVVLGQDNGKWDEFINLIKSKEHLFTEGILYCSEVLITGDHKYFDYKTKDAIDKLFIFDIKGLSDRYYKREYVEKLAKDLGLNVVPLTTFEHTSSQLNPNIQREGCILRYEDISGLHKDGTKDVIKLKYVETKKGKKQHIKIETINEEGEDND